MGIQTSLARLVPPAAVAGDHIFSFFPWPHREFFFFFPKTMCTTHVVYDDDDDDVSQRRCAHRDKTDPFSLHSRTDCVCRCPLTRVRARCLASAYLLYFVLFCSLSFVVVVAFLLLFSYYFFLLQINSLSLLFCFVRT